MFGDQVKFDDSCNYTTLVCPECGGNNLHQGTVEIFWRNTEDSRLGTFVLSSGHLNYVENDKLIDDCPSPRRSGLTIAMECENCGDLDQQLAVFQHKGCTFISWM